VAIDFSDPDATFRTRLLGFDKEQVRACLLNVAGDYAEAVRQIEWLTGQLKSGETSGKQGVRQEIMAAQVGQILASAHRVAEDVRVEAENAARQRLREAQEEAAQLRNQAEADASALASTAAAQLARLEAEIERMTALRQSVQATLNRAADRLNQIANDMRQGEAPTNPISLFPPERRTGANV
jgi:cell division septum initiation protein DivIVA